MPLEVEKIMNDLFETQLSQWVASQSRVRGLGLVLRAHRDGNSDGANEMGSKNDETD